MKSAPYNKELVEQERREWCLKAIVCKNSLNYGKSIQLAALIYRFSDPSDGHRPAVLAALQCGDKDVPTIYRRVEEYVKFASMDQKEFETLRAYAENWVASEGEKAA